MHETPFYFFPAVLKHFSVWSQLEANVLTELLGKPFDQNAEKNSNENLNNLTALMLLNTENEKNGMRR